MPLRGLLADAPLVFLGCRSEEHLPLASVAFLLGGVLMFLPTAGSISET